MKGGYYPQPGQPECLRVEGRIGEDRDGGRLISPRPNSSHSPAYDGLGLFQLFKLFFNRVLNQNQSKSNPETDALPELVHSQVIRDATRFKEHSVTSVSDATRLGMR